MYLVGQLLGAIIGFGILSRLLARFAFRNLASIRRLVWANAAAFAGAIVLGGFGFADGGSPQFDRAAGLYFLPALIWALVDWRRCSAIDRTNGLGLGGWQRAWVLSTGAWGLFVATLVLSSFPSAARIKDAWAYDAVDAIRSREQPQGFTTDFRASVFADASDDEVIRRITQGAERIPDAEYRGQIKGIRDRYAARLERLPDAQIEEVGELVLFWLIPALLLYAAGLAVRWVWAGFRRPAGS